MNISKKHIILALVVLVVAAVMAMAVLRASMQWQKNNYFGMVMQVSDERIVIRGPGNIETAFTLTARTEVRLGREQLRDGVHAGDHVIIIGVKNKAGELEAALIRIVTSEPRMQ